MLRRQRAHLYPAIPAPSPHDASRSDETHRINQQAAERVAFCRDIAKLRDVARQMADLRCPGRQPRQAQRTVSEPVRSWSRKVRWVRHHRPEPAWPIGDLHWYLEDDRFWAVSAVDGVCGVTASGAVVQMGGHGALGPNVRQQKGVHHLGGVELSDPELDLMRLPEVPGWSRSKPPLHPGLFKLIAIADAHDVRLRLRWSRELLAKYELERHGIDAPDQQSAEAAKLVVRSEPATASAPAPNDGITEQDQRGRAAQRALLGTYGGSLKILMFRQKGGRAVDLEVRTWSAEICELDDRLDIQMMADPVSVGPASPYMDPAIAKAARGVLGRTPITFSSQDVQLRYGVLSVSGILSIAGVDRPLQVPLDVRTRRATASNNS